MIKCMVVAGAFSALTCGVASASEGDIECQTEDARAQARERSVSVAAPPPTMVRPPESARMLAAAPTPSIAPRRRNGKTIPDAELIGPRGTL